MFNRSRYDGVLHATAVVSDGEGGSREVAYLLTRSPGDPAAMNPAGWHRVVRDDRLDLVADRYLGDVGAFWRICDANRALDPDDLVAPSAEGSVLVIPAPGT